MRAALGALALAVAVGCGGAPATTAPPSTTAPSTTTTTAASTTTTTAPSTTTTTAPSTTTTTVPPTTTALAMRTVSVFLARDGLLAAASRDVRADDALAETVRALLAGPTAGERAAGFASAIPDGTILRSVAVRGEVAEVDLGAMYESGGGSLSMMLRVAQVTYTVTQFAGVGAVRFAVDGRPVDALGGEGLLIGTPQTRADLEDVQPAVLVTDPGHGAVIGRRIVVRGTAQVSESVPRVQLLDASGTRIVDLAVAVTSGTGARGTWEQPIDIPATVAGAVTLRVLLRAAVDGADRSVRDELLTVA